MRYRAEQSGTAYSAESDIGFLQRDIVYVCCMLVHTTTLHKTRGVHRTHTPRGTSTGYSAATIDVTSLPIDKTDCLTPLRTCTYGVINPKALAYKQWARCHQRDREQGIVC